MPYILLNDTQAHAAVRDFRAGLFGRLRMGQIDPTYPHPDLAACVSVYRDREVATLAIASPSNNGFCTSVRAVASVASHLVRAGHINKCNVAASDVRILDLYEYTSTSAVALTEWKFAWDNDTRSYTRSTRQRAAVVVPGVEPGPVLDTLAAIELALVGACYNSRKPGIHDAEIQLIGMEIDGEPVLVLETKPRVTRDKIIVEAMAGLDWYRKTLGLTSAISAQPRVVVAYENADDYSRRAEWLFPERAALTG